MEHVNYLDLVEAATEGHVVVSGHMFGMPCLKVRNKVFAVAFEAGVVLKLSENARTDALKMPGATLWAPFSATHIKKEWVYFADVSEDEVEPLAIKAANYVSQLASSKKGD